MSTLPELVLSVNRGDLKSKAMMVLESLTNTSKVKVLDFFFL